MKSCPLYSSQSECDLSKCTWDTSSSVCKLKNCDDVSTETDCLTLMDGDNALMCQWKDNKCSAYACSQITGISCSYKKNNRYVQDRFKDMESFASGKMVNVLTSHVTV